MLVRDQFLRLAKALKAPNPAALEKDYALSCLLDGMEKVRELHLGLVFKGGTALRKVYSPDWRRSEDLDFSALHFLPQEKFLSLLQEAMKEAHQRHGIAYSLRHAHQPDGMMRLRVQYRGPLEYPSMIYADVTFDEVIVLRPMRRKVKSVLPDSPTPWVKVYPLEEVLAEKLRTLLERGRARDYYDAWRLLKEKRAILDLATTVKVLKEKCHHKGLRYRGIGDFLRRERIQEARPYWERELRKQLAELPSF